MSGAVQGVGFRPHVFRLARELGLAGWVRNCPEGVEMEIEGWGEVVPRFLERLRAEAPPGSAIREVETAQLSPVGDSCFAILASISGGGGAAGEILPDLAACGECVSEVFCPTDRRHLYPFANCAHCGPRYSIVERLPYDRENTTMRAFPMCRECLEEYRDPCNRRFHAQPIACPSCGPQVSLGRFTGPDAMNAAAAAIGNGQIVAVKGIGGFHLFADARDESAVARLRQRKRRPDKPLAVMFPNLDGVLSHCEADAAEIALLGSSAAPIVLLRKKSAFALAANLAPGNRWLGALLPYSPLHYLLVAQFGFPVVATSGNLSEEPICIDNAEAFQRLSAIADVFLIHDRPIRRAVDDSVACVAGGREMLLRRSRGYAPAPIILPREMPDLLALGGDLKNAIAVSSGRRVFLSQHHGDLAHLSSQEAFHRHARDLPSLCRASPRAMVCDLHPAFHSSSLAASSDLPVIRVQHHHSHIVSCLAENGIDEEVLGVAWDGTGYGPEGTVWGGEFLLVTPESFTRLGSLRSFPLPGGEKAIREPRRAALGALFEVGIPAEDTLLASAFEASELRIAREMLCRRINTPSTTSAGRLFDAAAALMGLRFQVSFEGQAAIELESILPGDAATFPGYDLSPVLGDWKPVLAGVIGDLASGAALPRISARFHNAMVGMIVQAAVAGGRGKVALSGGCFQNRYLLEQSILGLQKAGFEPIWHGRVPPNDGGLALGQIVAAARQITSNTSPCA